jgi:hypothetical protein
MTPPGISVSAANKKALVGIEQGDARGGVAGRVHDVEAEIAEIDRVALFEPDVDVDRHVRLVEHLAQHREVVAQHDLVGGEAMRRDIGALAVEMIGGADMVEMLMAQHHHIDLVRRDADMVEAGEEVRKVRGQPDIDQNRALGSYDEIGIGRAVLEADLVDVRGRQNQGADLGLEQGLEGRGPAVAHGFAAGFVAVLKLRSLEARRRFESASMIISANAGCWLTR